MARAWNRTDFDGAWKEALERYLRPFLALCFPKVEAGIDWRHPVEFVDKELPALRNSTGKGSAAGRKYVDKLTRLPEKEEQELMAELEKRQRRNVTTYITSFERHGLRKGMRKGLRQGLRQGRQEGRVAVLRELVREALEARFGGVSVEEGDRIESECDPEVLRHWHRRAITVSSTDQVWTSAR